MTPPDETNAFAVAMILRELEKTRDWWRELQAAHDDWERSLVRALRAAGATWRDVGEALQTTRQAAWEKFAEDDSLESE